jgi:ABC-type dipeptide/oligopeptide/nickel transport system ATPase component
MLIGFIGAPGCGKSTTAFGLCYELKKQGHAVEFVAEYARRHIMECRIKGIPGNGGFDGQTVIYNQDSANAKIYRQHAPGFTIADGSTVNCYFYGFDHIDLLEEAAKYDLLFYIPLTHTPSIPSQDVNRMQTQSELLEMGRKWENAIRPLIAKAGNIITLEAYPAYTPDEVTQAALAYINKTALAA